jgi:hypothetical protein
MNLAGKAWKSRKIKSLSQMLSQPDMRRYPAVIHGRLWKIAEMRSPVC